MNQNAIIKRELGSGLAEISLLRQVECGLNCSGNCSGCMQTPQKEILAKASNPIGAKPGQRVEVEPTAGHSIGIALLIFALPCLFLILGYGAGQWLGLGEGASVGTAALGLILGFIPAWLVNRLMTKKDRPEFVIRKQLA